MKCIAISLMTLVVAACAGTPQPDSSAPPNPAATVAATNSATKDGPLTSAKILELQREGYTLTNKNGEPYFCRADLKTGSRLAHETVCLTEKEIDELREQTQRSLSNIARERPPPQGH